MNESTDINNDDFHGKPLNGLLVVAMEQAVAAPYCSSRLADAGARVIKIERLEGDFARGYDRHVHGESTYFVWINRGKESIALDLKNPNDLVILMNMIAKADVFLQNLAPGAAMRLGLGSTELRERHPKLITCDISGYGEHGTQQNMKAYDLLVQAESGLISVSGASGEWGRIGVSLCDISAGMNALIAIQQALIQRSRTGHGSKVHVSLFDSAAELMSVPYLQTRYGGHSPQRVGLKHPSITPYGVFKCGDAREVVISIQNEREWILFCRHVLQRLDLLQDERCNNNLSRCENREFVDGIVLQVFASLDSSEIIRRLELAQTAYGNVNSVDDLINHPQLRTRVMPVGAQSAQVPALPWQVEWEDACFSSAPRINQHGENLRAEFSSNHV